MFFPHSHRFSLLFTKVHVGQEEYVIDERILKEMHYTGTEIWVRCTQMSDIQRPLYARFFIGIIVRWDRDLSFSTV